MEKIIDVVDYILDTTMQILMALVALGLLLLIVLGCYEAYLDITGKNLCAYCHNEVKSGTEIVYMTDGRKMHGECYLRYIEEERENDKGRTENAP